MNFDAHFAAELDKLKSEGNYRIFAEVERQCGAFPRVKHYDGPSVQEVTVWCSNDYLGMGHHADVVGSMIDAVTACGTGAGGTRNISGNNHAHRVLEDELADLHGKEAALLFTSGYVSNWAALSTLGTDRGSTLKTVGAPNASTCASDGGDDCQYRGWIPGRRRWRYPDANL